MILNTENPWEEKPDFNDDYEVDLYAFSVPISYLSLNNSGAHEFNEVDNTKLIVPGWRAGRSRFGDYLETDGINTGTVNLSVGSSVSAFTFAYYPAIDDAAIVSWGAQAPLFWADAATGLRPGLFSGAVLYGADNSLTSDVAGYRRALGVHCWGGTMVSGGEGRIYRNGILDAVGNIGSWVPSDVAGMHSNDPAFNETNFKNGAGRYYWTVVFDGALSDREALWITANPELFIERVLLPRQDPYFIADVDGITLSVQKSTTSNQSNIIALTQHSALSSVAKSTSNNTSESVSLSASIDIAVDKSLTSTFNDNADLSQSHVLTVSTSTSETTADIVTLSVGTEVVGWITADVYITAAMGGEFESLPRR